MVKILAVGMNNGVKVLKRLEGSGGLPEESHSGNAYILCDKQGNFKMMRLYNKEHLAVKYIACHVERKLDPCRKPLLHVHEYLDNGMRGERSTRHITKEEYQQYRQYFKRVPEYDKW